MIKPGDKQDGVADVCLVLEGTYPYISGGVSTWVHQIIQALPDLKFALFYVGAETDPSAVMRYEIPENVIGFEEVYLFDPLPKPDRLPGKARRGTRDEIYGTLGEFLKAVQQDDERERFVKFVEAVLRRGKAFSCANLWADQDSWELLTSIYQNYMEDESFLNYFWSSRFLVQPAWQLIRAVERMPKARVYHSLCTGYAGLASAMAAEVNDAHYLLSEHGIYVKERVAEVQNADWIAELPRRRPEVFEDLGSFKRLWVEFFKLLGRISYDSADHITSLFGNNKKLQVLYGANPEKVEIIPNGIRPTDFDGVLARREKNADPERKVVGFLGRVVGIKDVKTLLRAARLVVDRCREAQFLIAGPTDEDEEYAEACVQLVEQLDLDHHVKFLGSRQRDEFLEEIDVMVLTSVSEGLPFVIIESFAAGVPVVSTDVGSCRELIEGKGDGFGSAGGVTPIGDPQATAGALLPLLQNPELRRSMGEAGRARVAAKYDQEHVVQRYKELYLEE
jgi:glycosyltransferase involved in cell wall biosynthesis